ncbi:unnamed protein product, partial [Prorocentrum cordatum]
ATLLLLGLVPGPRPLPDQKSDVVSVSAARAPRSSRPRSWLPPASARRRSRPRGAGSEAQRGGPQSGRVAPCRARTRRTLTRGWSGFSGTASRCPLRSPARAP